MPHNNIDGRHDDLKEDRVAQHKNHHVTTVTPTDPVIGFTTIDDSSPNAKFNYATSVNDSGTVVGSYFNGAYASTTGFVDQGGTLSDFSIPGATEVQPFAVNDQGTVVGSDSQGGFVDQDGNVSLITISVQPIPGGGFTNVELNPTGINNGGTVVGDYWMPGDHQIGFIYANGTATSLTMTGASILKPQGINDSGEVVGSYMQHVGSAATRGFIEQGGTFTTLDAPGDTVNGQTFTSANGIDNAGDIVGEVQGTAGDLGFLLKGGQYTTFAAPGAIATQINSINPNGTEVAGTYETADGIYHGFIAGISGNTIS